MRNDGQIISGSNLGKWIENLSSNEDEVNTIIEVGTWYGMGSTLCIVNGLNKRKKPLLNGYSFEIDYMRYVYAFNKLNPLPENFYIVHGSVISEKELNKIKPENIEQELWLTRDKQNIKSCKYFSSKTLPHKIDLLILDGGAFTGLLEFETFKDHSKYIILDDTMVKKHRKTREYIMSGKAGKFDILDDNKVDRHGYLVCKRLV